MTGCFLLFCLSGLYLEGGVGVVQKMPDPPLLTESVKYSHYELNGHAIWALDAPKTANPMGRIAIGHEWEWGKVRFSLEARHESWIGASDDHGQNSVWGSVRVRPWAR